MINLQQSDFFFKIQFLGEKSNSVEFFPLKFLPLESWYESSEVVKMLPKSKIPQLRNVCSSIRNVQSTSFVRIYHLISIFSTPLFLCGTMSSQSLFTVYIGKSGFKKNRKIRDVIYVRPRVNFINVLTFYQQLQRQQIYANLTGTQRRA